MSIFSNLFGLKDPLFGKQFVSKKQLSFSGESTEPKPSGQEVHLVIDVDFIRLIYPATGKSKRIRWKLIEKALNSHTFMDEQFSQWIVSPTHITLTQRDGHIIAFVLGDPDNRFKISIEDSVTNGRLQLMKMLGMNIGDQIQSFHYCPDCRKTSVELAAIDDSMGNNLPAVAKILKNEPSRLIGQESLCKCGKVKTILTKLVYSRTSPRNNFDVHYYFQYNTSVSEYAVEIISLSMDGKLGRFSEADRQKFLGF
jgi:hypothetical protein